ncbi:MAG: GDSL family lipase [Ignavibacteria bacterium]|nr:MAG: GDSL family lipase [Ignavibacteria bacterium]KAF0160471.1 MAG: GDSL family lipase [Ignavibacteria bacterium]
MFTKQAFAAFIIVSNVLVCFAQPNSQQVDTLRYKKNPLYDRNIDLYKIYKPRQVDIVMFGNSLTQGASWSDLLGRNNVAGMGITSDILRGYLNRLNYVIRYKPKIVFVMGGINDIYNWTPVEEIFPIYIKIIEQLKANKIIPVIQSTTYAAKNYAKDWGGTPESNAGRNKETDKLNKMLSDYARKNKIDYIDVISQLSRNGYLRDEVTWDGVHFNAEAYRVWAREVEKVLAKYKL